MRRNTAQAVLRGFGTWWMDLPAEGWFNDARIWEEMSLLRPVDAAMLERRGPFAPEIAAVVDEESMCHLTGGSAAFAGELIYHSRAALGRSGAPYGQYLLDDVLVGRVPAKLQVFLSAWALPPAKRAALAGQCGPGVTRVWCYAPGYLYPDRAACRGDQGGDGLRGPSGRRGDGGSHAHGGREEARPRRSLGAEAAHPPALQRDGAAGRDAGDVFRRHARRRGAALRKGDRRLRRRASADPRAAPGAGPDGRRAPFHRRESIGLGGGGLSFPAGPRGRPAGHQYRQERRGGGRAGREGAGGGPGGDAHAEDGRGARAQVLSAVSILTPS